MRRGARRGKGREERQEGNAAICVHSRASNESGIFRLRFFKKQFKITQGLIMNTAKSMLFFFPVCVLTSILYHHFDNHCQDESCHHGTFL
jgi:hypothetical protein